MSGRCNGSCQSRTGYFNDNLIHERDYFDKLYGRIRLRTFNDDSRNADDMYLHSDSWPASVKEGATIQRFQPRPLQHTGHCCFLTLISNVNK